jgi:aspartyl-tRNA(Asn)/glutamyl-tRNA(Gln) amidotransferase subunit C
LHNADLAQVSQAGSVILAGCVWRVLIIEPLNWILERGCQSMALDKEIVARIAKLARLEITESDLEVMSQELSQILSWIEQLEEVNIEGFEPMTSVVKMDLKVREDVVTDGDQADHFFVVPKVIE